MLVYTASLSRGRVKTVVRRVKFIMLGKTVPEPTNGRLEQYVCSVGIEIDENNTPLGLVRLYPLAMFGAPARWSVSHVPVERNKRDNRLETWRPIGAFGNVGSLPKEERIKALIACRAAVSDRDEANKRRMSLAFLRPHNPKFWL